jgi:hypothetical protein
LILRGGTMRIRHTLYISVFLLILGMGLPGSAVEEADPGTIFVLKSQSGLIALMVPEGGKPVIRELPLKCDLGTVAEDGRFYSVTVSEEETEVGFHAVFPELQTVRKAKVPSPHIKSILAVEWDLYLGGKSLWRVNFYPAITQVEEYEKIPPEEEEEASEFFKNKTIDALTRAESTLYAVDNIYTPKYLLTYDVSQSFSPKHLQTKGFGGGVNQWVYGADADQDHLMLFEKYSRMDGWGTLISLYSRDPLKKIRQAETFFSRRESRWEDRDKEDWSNALLLDGKVVISGGKAGLLISDFSREEAPQQVHPSLCRWVLKRGGRLLALHGTTATVFAIAGDTLKNPEEIRLPAECSRIF